MILSQVTYLPRKDLPSFCQPGSQSIFLSNNDPVYSILNRLKDFCCHFEFVKLWYNNKKKIEFYNCNKMTLFNLFKLKLIYSQT